MTAKKANPDQLYFDQIKAFPLLDFEEEQSLGKCIQQGDKDALQKLVQSNLRLVVKIARSYLNTGIPFLDLIQEGNVGLIHAAERFNPNKQVRFSTYAGWWIRQSILRYLVNKHRLIRLPQKKEELFRKIQMSYQDLTQRLNRLPNAAEIAQELGVSTKDTNTVISLTSTVQPLETDAPDSTGVLDCHEDYTYNPERIFLKKDAKAATMKLLNGLKDREKKTLMHRYQFFHSGRET
jgi:RNA polymerase primary sigma factor